MNSLLRRTLLSLLLAVLLPCTMQAYQPLPQNDSIATDSLALDSLLPPQGTIAERLASLINDDSLLQRSQLGLCVYDLDDDSLLYASGAQQLMHPASCQKIITSVAALSTLGTDYRYRTQLYLAEPPAGDSLTAPTVYLRGGFDPLINAANLRAFADTLKHRGITRLAGVRFDRTMKDTIARGWGWCWDDKLEPLTPLLYNGRAGLEETFLRTLQNNGIAVPTIVRYEQVPSSATEIAQATHTVDQILLPMMKESNNLYAESLYYQLAAKAKQKNADNKTAIRPIDRLLRQAIGVSDKFKVADGSGLSNYNWTTAEILCRVLRYAYQNDNVYRHLRPSLPIAGRDGTLESRLKGSKAYNNVRAKTGTIDGVSTLAGYCTAANGHQLCFAILNQGVYKAAEGRRFQDKVCRILAGD